MALLVTVMTLDSHVAYPCQEGTESLLSSQQ